MISPTIRPHIPSPSRRNSLTSLAIRLAIHASTTSHTQIVPLPGGGYVLDTPGIRSFGLQNLDPLDLAFCFPEIKEWSSRCEYRNCTHTVEPHCAVFDAVEQGYIAQTRYVSYTLMLEDLQR